jgi:predicted amidohydrolase
VTDLRYAGFFHLDENHRKCPINLLKAALRESAQDPLFDKSLLVLPEAFNCTNYYSQPLVYKEVEAELKALSGERHLCFVVGLVRDEAPKYSEAILIDRDIREVLSHKTSRDNSPCYECYPAAADVIFCHRGLCIGALVCMDASEDAGQRARHEILLSKFGEQKGTKLLCVPARFRNLCPVRVAKTWSKDVSTVIANCGSFRQPSVVHFQSGQPCTAATDGTSHLHLAAIPPPKLAVNGG